MFLLQDHPFTMRSADFGKKIHWPDYYLAVSWSEYLRSLLEPLFV